MICFGMRTFLVDDFIVVLNESKLHEKKEKQNIKKKKKRTKYAKER